MSKIKDMVKDGKRVIFTKYRKGHLYYVTECGFEFPVPIDDTGDATFGRDEKAMLLMRYIRKHLAELQTPNRKCSKVLNNAFAKAFADSFDIDTEEGRII